MKELVALIIQPHPMPVRGNMGDIPIVPGTTHINNRILQQPIGIPNINVVYVENCLYVFEVYWYVTAEVLLCFTICNP